VNRLKEPPEGDVPNRHNMSVCRTRRLPMARPTISICIPAYNAEPWIAKAIESATRQTEKPEEIIVADDLSTDKTAEVAEAAGATVLRLPKSYANAARNAAAKHATGDLLFFLDADDWWKPEKIERHLDVWANNPQASAVFDQATIMWDEKRVKDHAGSANGWCDWKACADRKSWTCGSSFSVRRDQFIEVGGFNEEIKSWFDDVDLLVRLAQKFGPAFAIGESLTYYRYTVGSVSKTPPPLEANLETIFKGWTFATKADREWFTRQMALISARRTPLPASLKLFSRARWPLHQAFFWRCLAATFARTLDARRSKA
jgi:glycosyltransferase involved in cell wall biosynthesis